MISIELIWIQLLNKYISCSMDPTKNGFWWPAEHSIFYGNFNCHKQLWSCSAKPGKAGRIKKIHLLSFRIVCWILWAWYCFFSKWLPKSIFCNTKLNQRLCWWLGWARFSVFPSNHENMVRTSPHVLICSSGPEETSQLIAMSSTTYLKSMRLKLFIKWSVTVYT